MNTGAIFHICSTVNVEPLTAVYEEVVIRNPQYGQTGFSNAAQYIFNRSEKFDEKAGIMTEEIMKNVILSQSKPVP